MNHQRMFMFANRVKWIEKNQQLVSMDERLMLCHSHKNLYTHIGCH